MISMPSFFRPTPAALALLAASLLGACATTGPYGGNPANSQYGTLSGPRSDVTRTIAEGCIGGAVMGALAGAIFGDTDTKNVLGGAAAGAAVGCGAGYLIAQRKENYASDEAFLDDEIAHAQTMNRELTAYNARLRQDVADLRVEVQDLRARYDRGQASAEELRRRRQAVLADVQRNRQNLRNLESELEYKTTLVEQERQQQGNRGREQQLQREINQLSEGIDELRQNSETLVAESQSLSV